MLLADPDRSRYGADVGARPLDDRLFEILTRATPDTVAEGINRYESLAATRIVELEAENAALRADAADVEALLALHSELLETIEDDAYRS